jgi:hypothetical protein
LLRRNPIFVSSAMHEVLHRNACVTQHDIDSILRLPVYQRKKKKMPIPDQTIVAKKYICSFPTDDYSTALGRQMHALQGVPDDTWAVFTFRKKHVKVQNSRHGPLFGDHQHSSYFLCYQS